MAPSLIGAFDEEPEEAEVAVNVDKL